MFIACYFNQFIVCIICLVPNVHSAYLAIYTNLSRADSTPKCPFLTRFCMMMTRLACNQAIESSYWRMDNNSDVGLLTGYVLYWLPIELESMDLDTFSR
jgi:hypothetical protein